MNILLEKAHYVLVEMPGTIFSDECQEVRDRITQWFKDYQVDEDNDVDSYYVNTGRANVQKAYAASNILFVFRDPQMAMIFKLSFG